jgi:acetolactate synthase-1/2/3 large subunit
LKKKEAAELINNAKKPFILFGQGVILGQAEEEFKAFVEKSGIPAAWTILGLSVTNRASFKCRHVRNAWKLRTQRIDHDCDVLIAIGMRLMTALREFRWICKTG